MILVGLCPKSYAHLVDEGEFLADRASDFIECYIHAGKPALRNCFECRKPICIECTMLSGDESLCEPCRELRERRKAARKAHGHVVPDEFEHGVPLIPQAERAPLVAGDVTIFDDGKVDAPPITPSQQSSSKDAAGTATEPAPIEETARPVGKPREGRPVAPEPHKTPAPEAPSASITAGVPGIGSENRAPSSREGEASECESTQKEIKRERARKEALEKQSRKTEAERKGREEQRAKEFERRLQKEEAERLRREEERAKHEEALKKEHERRLKQVEIKRRREAAELRREAARTRRREAAQARRDSVRDWLASMFPVDGSKRQLIRSVPYGLVAGVVMFGLWLAFAAASKNWSQLAVIAAGTVIAWAIFRGTTVKKRNGQKVCSHSPRALWMGIISAGILAVCGIAGQYLAFLALYGGTDLKNPGTAFVEQNFGLLNLALIILGFVVALLLPYVLKQSEK